MIIIYGLTGITLLALLLSGIQGFFGVNPLGVHHFAFGFIAVIIYLLTEVLVIFFFVATGGSIKDSVTEGKSPSQYHQRSLAIKRKVYPHTLLNMLLMMTVFIMGGAVDTGAIPAWVHGTLYGATMVHFLFTIRRQHACLKENTALILAMTGKTPEM